ncbi:MAG TPA: branched-chain amino acid transaminase [Anaerolineaceae bacterium]|nr:branched-chain amino acid transaminase [Anaerolineaceae bacterium]HPN53452.1 branched-chain amino acid transaminase [Anaerolineaceae bacterium]
MAINVKFIWMDGQMMEAEKATVPFLNTTLHYGLGVFEGIRCYDADQGPAIFRLAEHMERLNQSAKVLGFRQLPYSVETLCQAARDVVSVNGLRSCYIRPLIFHDSPSCGLNLDAGQARVGIAAWEWNAYLGEDALEKGVRMNVSSFTRHHPNISMTKAKITGNYTNSVLAKTESIRLGFDEALMLDPQGYVAECTGENLFLVRKGVLYTPHTAAILEGLTRDALITLARDLGYTVVEEPISRDQLYIADEVFVSGTAAEVVPVTEVDFRVIGSGKMGPITRAVQQAFHAAIKGRHPRSAGWLDYIS